jgi:hypothetical protein
MFNIYPAVLDSKLIPSLGYSSKAWSGKWEVASRQWILSLDADEALSEALEAEIWNLKKTGPDCDAYTMPRLQAAHEKHRSLAVASQH